MGTFGTPSSYNNTGALGGATNPTTAQGLSRDRENQKAILELPGTQAWVEKTITDGVIIPTSAEIIVLPEGGASTDPLTTIALTSDGTTTLHEGMLIRLKAANSNTITVVHGTGTNNISTIGGNNVVLDTTWYLELKLINGLWVQQETSAYKTANEAKITAETAATPATTTSRGIGRVATQADMTPGATITNGPAFLDAETVKITSTPTANAVPKADANGKIAAGWVTGSMYCNKRMIITTSGNFVPTRTGWHKIRLIAGGGPGVSCVPGSYNGIGYKGGNSIFNGVTAMGGSPGLYNPSMVHNAAKLYRVTCGGYAGDVVETYMYLTAEQSYPVTIGAGGAARTDNATSPGGLTQHPGGYGYIPWYESSDNFVIGGNGGFNGTPYGGGGGGASSTLGATPPPSTTGGGGLATGNAEHGYLGILPSIILAGAGGKGALIVEYFDPSVTS